MNKVKNDKAKAYWALEVEQTRYTEVTREADPGDEWSREDLEHSVSIYGLRMGSGDSVGDVLACFEPIPGELLHLLHVQYSTGDSFHSESGLVEPVAVFRTLELAQLARAELERAGTNEAVLGIFDEDGSVKVIRPVWCGYFESFGHAAIDSFEVSPAKEPKAGAGVGRRRAP